MADERSELQRLDLSIADLQVEITKLVWKNESLRGEMQKDPKGVIERELNIKLEDGLEVHVIDVTNPKVVYFVLPHHPQQSMGVEFTDEQLDAIAGGYYVNNRNTPYNVFTAGEIGNLNVTYKGS